MKTALLIIVFLFLVGCGDFPPGSDAEAVVMIACIEKGWVPKLDINNAQRELTCRKPE